MVRPYSLNGCNTLLRMASRNNLSDVEKAAYIDAELCLMSSPPKLNIEGAKNRWDELMYSHVVQSNVIHDVVRSRAIPYTPLSFNN